MTKQSGLGDNLYVDGLDLSGDIGSVDTISGGCAVLDVTGINKSAPERLGGLRDGNLEYTAFFNDATGQAHPTMKPTLFTGLIDRNTMYCRGTTLGKPAASIIARQLDYAGTRSADGAFTFKVPNPANGFALEWGEQHTAGKRTDGSATNGTGVDAGAASSFGLQAYLHVFSFTGTSVVVKLQESSDNAVGDPYADVTGGAFTSVTTAPGAQRIATAGNLAVERWLRVVTTGTFSNVVFAVNVVRNLTAVTF